MDYDRPEPYFRWLDVKPGRFVVVIQPFLHYFMDGQVGFKIEEPHEVRFIDTNSIISCVPLIMFWLEVFAVFVSSLLKDIHMYLSASPWENHAMTYTCKVDKFYSYLGQR